MKEEEESLLEGGTDRPEEVAKAASLLLLLLLLLPLPCWRFSDAREESCCRSNLLGGGCGDGDGGYWRLIGLARSLGSFP